MQNIEAYERGVHNGNQAARKLRHCFSVFSIRVGYRTLTSFEAGIIFVLALQINEMITASLNKEAFDLTRFSVIMFLILISLVFSYSKERFAAEYEDTLEPCNSRHEHSNAHPRSSFAHTFHQ
jgi:hypothetical protein